MVVETQGNLDQTFSPGAETWALSVLCSKDTFVLCHCRKLAEEKYEEIHSRRRELRSRHFETVSLDVLKVRVHRLIR